MYTTFNGICIKDLWRIGDFFFLVVVGDIGHTDEDDT